MSAWTLELDKLGFEFSPLSVTLAIIYCLHLLNGVDNMPVEGAVCYVEDSTVPQ